MKHRIILLAIAALAAFEAAAARPPPGRQHRRRLDARRRPRPVCRQLRRRRAQAPAGRGHGLRRQPLRLPADHDARIARHAHHGRHAFDARRNRRPLARLRRKRRRGTDRRAQGPGALQPDSPDARRGAPATRARSQSRLGCHRGDVGGHHGRARRRGLLARFGALRLGNVALLRPRSTRMGSPQQPRTLQPLIHHPRVAHALRKGTLPQHPQLGHRSHRQKQERQGRAGGRGA